MIDYEQTIQKIINSITNFSFEFDFETLKKEMELKEVSKDQLEQLGEKKVKEKFDNGFFKIKLPNDSFIDANSITKYTIDNNIKEPIIFINPNFKYVQWVIKKDFTTSQIKVQIKNQLKNNTDINLAEVQKALVIADSKNKKTEGYIGELPIKTSQLISEGKFHIQSSCSPENAIKMINKVLEELATEKKIYVTSKIKRDYKNMLFYFLFVIFVSSIWFTNKQFPALPIWLSNALGLVLFLIPLVIMRLINHSFFETLFFRKKAEKKYEKEFSTKII